VSRIKSIAVPTALLLATAAVAGCGSSAKDSTTTTGVAATPSTTAPATTPTTQTSTGTTTTNPTDNPTKSADIADSLTNKGGAALGKAAKLTAANGGVLTITFNKFYDPVHSASDFDPAPPGYRYIGVTVTADYQGNSAGVVSSTSYISDGTGEIPNSLLADPDCGRNIVNIELLGKGEGKRGCIVGLAPKGTKAKSILVILRSGTDRSKSARVTVPLK
jgi:hypothetical protein